MSRALFFVVFMICSTFSFSQFVFVDFNQDNFQVQIRYGDSIGYQVEGGYEQLDSLSKEFCMAFEENLPGEKQWLVYTHSLYGAFPIYSNIANWVIQRNITDSTGHLLIRVQWGSWNPLYGKNQEIALQRGEYLAQFLKPFLGSGYAINMLLHSMGSKLLQGALPKLDTTEQLAQVIFVAPDLDVDYFVRDSQLISNHLKHAHCFHTKNDIFLWIAEELNEKPRMGRLDSANIHLPYITFYNTNEMDCLFNNNHANWLTCGEVQATIRKILDDPAVPRDQRPK